MQKNTYKGGKILSLRVRDYFFSLMSFINRKSDVVFYGILITSLFVIVPLLIISFYSQPVADDFCFALKTREFGLWGSQVYWYVNWIGRFFSTGLLSVIPLMISLRTQYYFVPVALIILLFISSVVLGNVLLKDYLPTKFRIVLGTGFFLCYVILMPSLVQGFYWAAGAITYTLSAILFLLYFSLFIVFRRQTNLILKLVLFLLLAVCAVSIVGSNEVSMVLMTLTSLSVFVYDFILKNKGKLFSLAMFIVVVLSSALVFLSPGNSIRTNTLQGYSFISSIVWSFFNSVKIISENFASTNFWLFTFIFVPIGYLISKQITKRNIVFSVTPVIPFVILVVLLAILSFPAFYKLGSAPPLRLSNLLEFVFLIGWFFCLQILICYLSQKKIYMFTLSNCWTLFFLAIIVITTVFSKTEIKTVYFDLINGNALNYRNEMISRYTELQNNKGLDKVYLEKIGHKPNALFLAEINEDVGLDKCLAEYFYVDKVLLKNP